MQDWIIKRYNEGQDKYKITTIKEIWDTYRLTIEEKACNTTLKGIYLYNFLFNPKWLFAKAFWGEERVCLYCGHKFNMDYVCCTQYEAHCPVGTDYPASIKKYKYHLSQMVLYPDPLKYLEQFRENNEK